MSDKLQSLETIKPISESGAATNDPVKAEYEEGKKYIESEAWGQAAVALHNALVGFEEKNDDAGIANASNQLGHVCLAREDYENALKHYQRAYEIVEKAYDRMSVLAVLTKMVEANRGLKDYPAAIGTCLQMIDLYHDNRDPRGTVESLDLLAGIYSESGDNLKAADTYKTIASIHRNFTHHSIAQSYLEKADALESAN